MINIARHIKSLNKLACDPHGYWFSDNPLFNPNTQKIASNDNEWRLAA